MTETTDRKADILQEIKNILRDNCEIEIDLDDLDGINDTEDLDSEKLASLLNYKLTLDTFWTFSSDLDALIDERHEIDEEDDEEEE